MTHDPCLTSFTLAWVTGLIPSSRAAPFWLVLLCIPMRCFVALLIRGRWHLSSLAATVPNSLAITLRCMQHTAHDCNGVAATWASLWIWPATLFLQRWGDWSIQGMRLCKDHWINAGQSSACPSQQTQSFSLLALHPPPAVAALYAPFALPPKMDALGASLASPCLGPLCLSAWLRQWKRHLQQPHGQTFQVSPALLVCPQSVALGHPPRASPDHQGALCPQQQDRHAYLAGPLVRRQGRAM